MFRYGGLHKHSIDPRADWLLAEADDDSYELVTRPYIQVRVVIKRKYQFHY